MGSVENCYTLSRKMPADEDGRLMLAETSSLATYELTRRFYLKHGYEIGAVIKDYYDEGHDMVIFRKRLNQGKGT